MPRPGFEPTRRNRNQGTNKRGHGQDNRMVIPEPGAGRLGIASCSEQLGPHVLSSLRSEGFRSVSLIVERARNGFVHACTVDDLLHVLRLVPSAAVGSLAAIVLRVPTRKQRLLAPVWGRCLFSGILPGVRGPMVLLEAVEPGKPIFWGRSLGPEAMKELDRIREAGHEVRLERGRWYVTPTLESCRATQLFHTLPHELGHLVDFRAWDRRGEEDRFWARPSVEREQYAHRYADTLRASWKKRGVVPFPRSQSRATLARLGLAASDLGLTKEELDAAR